MPEPSSKTISPTSTTSPEYLARSGDERVSTQTYFDHVGGKAGVISTSLSVAERTFSDRQFIETVKQAAILHDLGKLHEPNQKVLSAPNGGSLPVRHERAGVSLLRKANGMAAMLVQSHHQNLPNIGGYSEIERGIVNIEWMDNDPHADRLLSIHNNIFKGHPEWQYAPSAVAFPRKLTPLDVRMMLSCIVDADHGNSARHKGHEPLFLPGVKKWKEWLERLKTHVESIRRTAGNAVEMERQRLRDLNFSLCLGADTDKGFRTCDAPVGTGKTYACLAHAFNVAAMHDMSHIITVLPLTTIIDQTVDAYRKAILRGETESTVSAVHHAVEYNSTWGRKYCALFNSPLIVTTSVNFFETLAAKTTSGLRKLHQYRNSVIIIDESHLSLHLSQWRFGWRWLKQLVDNYGCHVILASGTPIHFWEHQDSIKRLGFVSEQIKVRPLLDEIENAELRSIEGKRVTVLPSSRELTSLKELGDKVAERSGPTVVVFNTIKLAARFAHYMTANSALPVFHISTALTPIDKRRQLDAVKMILKDKLDCIVCGTSVIETGVDISFRRGFRQRSGMYQMLQLTGRVNRNFEYGENCEIEEFRLHGEDDNGSLYDNPHLASERVALERFLSNGNVISAANCNRYLLDVLREMQREPNFRRLANLEWRERYFDFETVRNGFDVIETNQRTVIVNDELVAKIQRMEIVTPLDITLNSVRVGIDRMINLGLPVSLVISDGSSNPFLNSLIFMEERFYDSFYGYLRTMFIPANPMRTLIA